MNLPLRLGLSLLAFLATFIVVARLIGTEDVEKYPTASLFLSFTSSVIAALITYGLLS